jgi:hypothetical protein
MLTITWKTPAGNETSSRQQTAVEAISKAAQLIAQGFENVTVWDDRGKAHTPADFRRLCADH